jgi:YidC/Oxa1 family membrane protein insertase
MMNTLIEPIYRVLLFLYQVTGNLGVAIIVLTLAFRLLLVPITLPSLKMAKSMQALKPQLDKLKKKYSKDAAGLQKAQMELYKQNGVNPASGCLPQIIQLVLVIGLYQVFVKFLHTPDLQSQFLWLNLTKPDHFYVLPVLSGLTQLIFSLMLQPGVVHEVENPKNKVEKQKEEDSLEMAQSIQQQMVFMMPFMTFLIALNFPSGLSLYWTVTTVFSIIQQYVFSGPGGLMTYYLKVKSLLIKNDSTR